MKKGIYSRWLIFIVAICFTLNVNSQHKKVTPEVVASFTDVIQNQSMSVTDFLLSSPEYSTFVNALKVTKSLLILETEGKFTVFAPNNDAFAQFPPEVMKQLFMPKNIHKLKSIVDYHIVNDMVNLNEELLKLNGTKYLNSINSEMIEISLGSEETLLIHDANGYPLQVTQKIIVSNAIIYAIDAVLLPQVDVKVASN